MKLLGFRAIDLLVTSVLTLTFVRSGYSEAAIQKVEAEHPFGLSQGECAERREIPRILVNLADNDRLDIRINNTYSKAFEWSLAAETTPSDTSAELEGRRVRSATETVTFEPDAHTIRQVHQHIYGRYVLTVTRKAAYATLPYIAVKVGDENRFLCDTFIWTVEVEHDPWTVDVSGGFAVNWVTNPVWQVIGEGEGDALKNYVVRDPEAEGGPRVEPGIFIHTSHEALPLAATFGIGVNANESPSYFVGATVRFGTKAAAMFGAAFSRVDVLPAGVQESASDDLENGFPVSDPNVLANLRDRTHTGLYFGFTYSFITTGEETITKSFAPPKDEK